MNEKRKIGFSKALVLGLLLMSVLSLNSLLYGNDIERRTRDRRYEEFNHILENLEPVNLDEIPVNSYHRGIIQIQITPEAGYILKDNLLSVDEGFVRTNIPELDFLNERFSVTEYRPLLEGLYESCEKSAARRYLHRDWGFHLWFDLSFDENTDVIEVVKAYAKLSVVNISEPLYVKELIEPVEVIDIEDEDNPGTRWAPNDPHYTTYQWALNNTGQRIEGRTGTAGADISAEAAWEIEKGHQDVIVAVFDNGMAFRHRDLEANVWENIGPDGTNTPGNAHGTHVAGTIAAVTNNNIGVAGIAGGSGQIDDEGVADGVKVMGCNIFNTNMSYTSRKMYATENGAAISQNSWGYVNYGTYNQADLNAITYFNANAGGDVLDGGITIFAAGNDDRDDRKYPAYFTGALAVASTFNRDQKSGFSNYGEWVDISAPGSLIVNTVGTTNYTLMSGTSMACPHVSGVAALVVSNAHRNAVLLTNDELKHILLTSTDNIDAQNQNFIGRLGSGRVNAHSALVELENNYLGIRNPESFSARADSTTVIKLSWQPNEEENEVMITWSRNPALGRPNQGTFYAVGHNIEGGGEVLYKGSDTTFVHTGLDAGRTYYYRAFSLNEALDYSGGLPAVATTDAPTFSLPYYEDFDEEDVLPAMWQVNDLIGHGQVWEIGRFEGGLEGTTGNYLFINSNAYEPEDRQNTQVITPIIDMSDSESVSLRFNHFFEESLNSNGTIFYSLNGGASWSFHALINSSTENPETYEAIIPALAGHSRVRIRWGFFGQGARHWCIDDIELFETVYFPPDDLEATASDSTITITWQRLHDEEIVGYNVYRDGDLLTGEPINDTIYVDSEVEKDVLYTYYLRTIYEEGISVPSEKVQAIIEDDDPEPIEVHPPRNLSAKTEGYDVYLAWDIPEDMVIDSLLSYRVYRNNIAINVDTVVDTGYIDFDLEPENTYTYHITTIYGEKESDPSDSVVVKMVYVEDVSSSPVTYLGANYPNPFNPRTTIGFYIATGENVFLEVFDIRGRRITTLLNEPLTQGSHQVIWNGTDHTGNEVGSGIYFYRLTTDSYTDTGKMILMK